MSQPTVQPGPAAAGGASGSLLEEAAALLRPLDTTGTGSLHLEVALADSPSAWMSIGHRPCTWSFKGGVFTATLADGATRFEVPTPDYPCAGVRWSVYAAGTLLIASASRGPAMRGDYIRWEAAQ